MSTRFTVYCETCEEAGPHIRRHHRGAFLMAADTARFFPDHDEDHASNDWGSFLIAHEYHDLSLKTEYERELARAIQEENKRRETQPTHRLMPDGSLEPL